VRFQIGKRDIHPQFFRQTSETQEEVAPAVDRRGSPRLSFRRVEWIPEGSGIPKLWEYYQVCSHGFGFPAALESLFEVAALIVAVRRNLK
jgi:hypothetical protein